MFHACIARFDLMATVAFFGIFFGTKRGPSHVCRVSGPEHSTKTGIFAECQGRGTRQTRSCLPSAEAVRHSANTSWPSPRRHINFFCRALVSVLGNVFAECPIKNTRQINFFRRCVRRVPFAECFFLDFAVCCGHTANLGILVVSVRFVFWGASSSDWYNLRFTSCVLSFQCWLHTYFFYANWCWFYYCNVEFPIRYCALITKFIMQFWCTFF